MSEGNNVGEERKVPFYTQTAMLDTYLRSSDPSGDPLALDVILKTLREHGDLRTYFFRSNPHPAWAPVLWNHGFFQAPPAPQQTEKGLFLLGWDEQDYLISIASSVPDIVLKHFIALKNAPEYGARAIYALQSIPVELVESVLPQMLDWLRDPLSGRITAAAIYELAVKLAEKNQVVAFELFRAALAPQPAPKVQRIEGSLFGTEAVSLFDFDYIIDETVRFERSFKLFASFDLRQTVAVFEDHLLQALRLEAEAKGFKEYEISSWWRNTIEDSDQDIRDDYKHKLLGALRDLVCSFAEINALAAQPLICRYLADEHEILRRLGLHVLSRFPGEYPSYVARELLNESNLDDAGIHHEYFLLLRDGYSHLRSDEQKTLLELIHKGPPQETVERMGEWAHSQYGESRETYIQSYQKTWRQKRLWMLKENLTGEDAQVLQRLIAELAEPERPEYTHWTGDVYFVSDVSPLSREELYVMSPDNLVNFLFHWKPEREHLFGPERVTRGALGQVVADMIFSDFDRYAKQVETIAFLGPAFAVPIIAGFTPKKERSVRWFEALNLCERLLRNSNVRESIDNEADENWRGVRQTMVSLLEAGVAQPKSETIIENSDFPLPAELLPRVRDALITLIEDVDPTPENDRPPETYFGHNDPATVALNHVRPRAMLALVQYAIYRARSVENDQGVLVDGAKSRLEPQVRDALSRRLDPRIDPSSAVRSTYGTNLYRLRWLDQEWLEEHIDAIFPESDEAEAAWLFVAAWDAYVAFNRNIFVRTFFEKLRPKYERAIDNLACGLVTQTHLEPTRGLAAHLLRDYLDTDYQLRSAEGRNSLLGKFFKKAPAKERGGAAWLLWRMCEDNPQHLKSMWPRVRSLWEWRVEESARANHPTDFDKEMEWYARLPLVAFDLETIRSIWNLLEGTLPHIVRFEHQGIGWDSLEDYLVKEVNRDPERAIQFYHLMHKNKRPSVWFYHKPEGRIIIETAASNEDSRQEALALIDTLARFGNHQYRDIYLQYAG